jgi:hypothetical protein
MSPPLPFPLLEGPVDDKQVRFVIGLGLGVLLGALLGLFGGPSIRKDKAEVSSAGTTIIEPMEVGGKVVYRTIYKTETKTKRETVEIRSGVSVGAASTLNGDRAAWASADLFALGPGNVQGMAFYDLRGSLYLGAGYRLNFF